MNKSRLVVLWLVVLASASRSSFCGSSFSFQRVLPRPARASYISPGSAAAPPWEKKRIPDLSSFPERDTENYSSPTRPPLKEHALAHLNIPRWRNKYLTKIEKYSIIHPLKRIVATHPNPFFNSATLTPKRRPLTESRPPAEKNVKKLAQAWKN